MQTMGLCVLITPLLGFASGTFASQLLTNVLLTALCIGLLWAIIVFIIDRAVVSATKPGEINFGVLGRIFLACAFAVIISVPIELKLFNDAIIEKLNDQLTKDAKRTNEYYDGEIQKINLSLVKAHHPIELAKQTYIVELDGGAGRKVAGNGAIAKLKGQLYREADSSYKIYAKDQQAEINSLNIKRRIDLKNLGEFQAKGFLGQIESLDKLSDENKHVFSVIWGLRIFMLLIELTPIFIKLGMSRKDNVYHDIVTKSGGNSLIIYDSTQQLRTEVIVKSETLKAGREILGLDFFASKYTIEDGQLRFDYYMNQLQKANDKKFRIQCYILKNIKNSQERERLLEQVESIYDGFYRLLQETANKGWAGVNIS